MERHLYKGVAKKSVQVPLQQLVPILPAEEQISIQTTTDKAVPLYEVKEAQASWSYPVRITREDGEDPAPHDEAAQGVVNYGVAWNEVDKKYEWNAEWAMRKQEALSKKHEVPATGRLGDKHVRAVYEAVKIKIDEKPNSEENQVDKQPEENDENFAKLSQAPGKGKN